MFPSNVKRRQISSSRRNQLSLARSRSRRFSLESLEPRMMLTGTWTPLVNVIPASNQGGMQLLTDGSVMEVGTGAQAWVKLTPDATGSYVSGTWSTLASMSTLRDFDATRVLQDGRVLVLGGQYTSPPYTNTNTNTGEIYNPLTNQWSNITPFPEPTFGASATTLLSDGRLLAGSPNGPQTYIYDPATDAWTSDQPGSLTTELRRKMDQTPRWQHPVVRCTGRRGGGPSDLILRR